MLTIEQITNPIYTNVENTEISVMVKFAEFDEFLPFGANPHDPTAHGQEIYRRLVEGEVGPISEYIAPVATQPQPATTGAQTL